jgi:hypothetical protein
VIFSFFNSFPVRAFINHTVIETGINKRLLPPLSLSAARYLHLKHFNNTLPDIETFTAGKYREGRKDKTDLTQYQKDFG